MGLPATRLTLRARSATAVVVLRRCCCVMGVIGVTTRAASCPRCLACRPVTGCALGVLLVAGRSHYSRPSRPAPGWPVPLMMMWRARCVLASMARLRCCCVMAVTGASIWGVLGCVADDLPLVPGTALVALAFLLPPLAVTAAVRGPMALALRP